MKLHNSPVMERLFEYFKIKDCKPSSTPIPSGFHLSKEERKKVRSLQRRHHTET